MFIVWSKLAVYMLLMMLYYKLTVDMLLIMSKCAQYTDHVVLQVDNILVTDISKKMQLAKKMQGNRIAFQSKENSWISNLNLNLLSVDTQNAKQIHSSHI